jgi:hypothetical protein
VSTRRLAECRTAVAMAPHAPDHWRAWLIEPHAAFGGPC